MQYAIKVSIDKFTEALDDVQARQIPFAMKTGLNKVATLAQDAIKDHVKSVFKLRRPGFILMNVAKIMRGDWATKTAWRVIIQVDPRVANFMVRMEGGDDHVPAHGRWLWFPNDDVFQDKIILRSNPLHPANLKFERRGGQMLGNERTFMLKPKNRLEPIVLQRVDRSGSGVTQPIPRGLLSGKERAERATEIRRHKTRSKRRVTKGGVRMLYRLTARSKVPAKLEFIQTITNNVNANWEPQMTQTLASALSSAK